MRYYSTRTELQQSPSKAILEGLAGDGGLYLPEQLLPIDYHDYLDLSYGEIAFRYLSDYLDDLPQQQLHAAIQKAYSSENFSLSEISALHLTSPKQGYLELYHGKTLAFKDHALSLFPSLLTLSKQHQHQTNDIWILSATSGDTGKAAMEAIADQSGLSITVLYPSEGVSQLQQAQMQTQSGQNVDVLGIEGNFDDAQRTLKEAFTDDDLLLTLAENSKQLSSANSINIARLLPQVVYYIDAYVRLVKNASIRPDERINVIVPSGNFGNILAAYLAKESGLPLNRLIVATNENKVLDDFIRTGVFSIHERSFHKTHSPSMDILVPSNLERFLALLYGTQQTKRWMKELVSTKSFALTPEQHDRLQQTMVSYHASNSETLDSIQDVFATDHYLIDPHTACAHVAYTKDIQETQDSHFYLLVSTANPFKFSEAYSTLFALNEENPYLRLQELAAKTDTEVPAALRNLQTKPIRFTTVLKKEEIIPYLIQKVKTHD